MKFKCSHYLLSLIVIRKTLLEHNSRTASSQTAEGDEDFFWKVNNSKNTNSLSDVIQISRSPKIPNRFLKYIIYALFKATTFTLDFNLSFSVSEVSAQSSTAP